MSDCSSYDIYSVNFSSLNNTGNIINFSFSGNNDSLLSKKYVAGECNFFLVKSEPGIGRPQTWQWVVTLENDNLHSVLTGVVDISAGIRITQGDLWNLILQSRKKTIGNLTLESPDFLDISTNINYIVYTVGISELPDSGKLYLYIINK
jgi:hypothetical protein